MHKTREEWLVAAYKMLSPRFKEHGKLPEKVHILASWPYGTKKAVGQCFAKTWTKDESTYITISPEIEGEVEVLAILIHEMIHAAIGLKEKHGPVFKKVATALGLEGKMRATVAGELLKKDLAEEAKELGKYPHSVMVPHKTEKPKREGRKNPTKMVSPENDNYIIYISIQRLDAFGPPLCPFSKKPMVEVS
jgi:hypothetical protein